MSLYTDKTLDLSIGILTVTIDYCFISSDCDTSKRKPQVGATHRDAMEGPEWTTVVNSGWFLWLWFGACSFEHRLFVWFTVCSVMKCWWNRLFT